MTKINENGQLEFTFEELDLEGALAEIMQEIVFMARYCDKLSKRASYYRYANGITDEYWEKFSSPCDTAHNEWKLLIDIRENLLRLIRYGK